MLNRASLLGRRYCRLFQLKVPPPWTPEICFDFVLVFVGWNAHLCGRRKECFNLKNLHDVKQEPIRPGVV